MCQEALKTLEPGPFSAMQRVNWGGLTAKPVGRGDGAFRADDDAVSGPLAVAHLHSADELLGTCGPGHLEFPAIVVGSPYIQSNGTVLGHDGIAKVSRIRDSDRADIVVGR